MNNIIPVEYRGIYSLERAGEAVILLRDDIPLDILSLNVTVQEVRDMIHQDSERRNNGVSYGRAA